MHVSESTLRPPPDCGVGKGRAQGCRVSLARYALMLCAPPCMITNRCRIMQRTLEGCVCILRSGISQRLKMQLPCSTLWGTTVIDPESQFTRPLREPPVWARNSSCPYFQRQLTAAEQRAHALLSPEALLSLKRACKLAPQVTATCFSTLHCRPTCRCPSLETASCTYRHASSSLLPSFTIPLQRGPPETIMAGTCTSSYSSVPYSFSSICSF